MTDPTPGIRIEREFDAPRELVFAAWTTPASFATWFGGSATTVEDVVMDVRPGGAWSARMVLEGGHVIAWSGEFVEVEPPARLTLTISDDPAIEAGAPLTVDLEDLGGRTRMVFTQTGGGMTAEQYAQAGAGWQTFFDAMAGLLAA